MKCHLRALGLALTAAASTVLTGTAGAATSEVSPSGFLVSLRYEVNARPHRIYEALGEVDKWWTSAHTWSGSAANLSLSRQASGCFCERWGANSVEHGRVV